MYGEHEFYTSVYYFIKIMRQLLLVAVDAKTNFLNECFYYIFIQQLLIISGDVEINPGPNDTPHYLSVLHSNIRSIRNKLDYIKAWEKQWLIKLNANKTVAILFFIITV